MSAARLALVGGEADGADASWSVPRPAPRGSSARVRIVDGALACLARQGIAKTTIDDVARRAGCSRATVYRVFPGGKDQLLAAVADTEVARFTSAVAVRMGEADDLEDAIVAGIVEAAVRVQEHPALTYLLRFEPEHVLPHLAFDHLDDLLAAASAFVAPFLARWLAADEAARTAEWATRIVVSYLSCPSEHLDPTDPVAARRLVRTYVLPAVESWRERPPIGAAPTRPPSATHREGTRP